MSKSEGMRAGDFTKCAGCGRGVAHTGLPLFWRVKLERMGINHRAVQQADAMERYMGGAVALARVFEDPEIAKPIEGIEAKTVLVCEQCAIAPNKPLALLAEQTDEAEVKAIDAERKARDAAG